MKQNTVIDNGFPRIALPQEEAAASAYTAGSVSETSNTNATFTAAELAPGIVYQRNGSPTAPLKETLPTATVMNTYFPDVAVGSSWETRMLNNTGMPISIAPATGFSVSGGFIPPGYEAILRISKTGATTWTAEFANNLPGTGVPSVAADATVGAATVTAAELGRELYKRSGNAAVADTLPTGAQMDAAFPSVQAGHGWLMTIKNNNTGAYTLTAAAGFTISGDAALNPIPTATAVLAIVTRVAANSWNIELQ